MDEKHFIRCHSTEKAFFFLIRFPRTPIPLIIHVCCICKYDISPGKLDQLEAIERGNFINSKTT